MNIILFDDDKWLREKCKELIRKSGHSIHLSTDSVSEVERYLKRHNEPALFFVDIMIGLNNYAGLTLVDTIKTVNENHVVVFMTGYPDLILYNTHSKTRAIKYHIENQGAFWVWIYRNAGDCRGLISRKCLFPLHHQM